MKFLLALPALLIFGFVDAGTKPAHAVIYCTYVGYPVGCIARAGVVLRPRPVARAVVGKAGNADESWRAGQPRRQALSARGRQARRTNKINRGRDCGRSGTIYAALSRMPRAICFCASNSRRRRASSSALSIAHCCSRVSRNDPHSSAAATAPWSAGPARFPARAAQARA